MSPSATTVGRRMVVWMVSVAASLETTASGVIAWRAGRNFDLIVWALATACLAAMATNIERIKLFLEE